MNGKNKNKCKYKDRDRRLKEQFINGINNHTLTMEIIRELTVLKDMNQVTSGQILPWV